MPDGRLRALLQRAIPYRSPRPSMKTPLSNLSRPTIKALLIATGLITTIQAQAAIKESTSYADPKHPTVTCTDEASGKAVACPVEAVKNEAGSGPIQIAFHAADFSELDKIFDRISSGEERFADGDAYLMSYLTTLDKLYTGWQRWDEHLGQIKQWQNARPASMAAKFAEARYWHTYAWHARGSGVASQVTKEGWELFRERLAKATAVLDELQPLAKRIPAWYTQKIQLAIDSGNDKLARATFDEGIAQHRQFYPLYLVMARTYQAKWGGSDEKLEQFADEAVKLAKGFEGRGMYSRIFWAMDVMYGTPFISENNPVPNWKKLNAGFADLLKYYPKGDNILNQYASVACRSNDSKLYRKLRTQLGSYLDESSFTLMTVDVCDRRHKWKASQK